MRCAGKNAGGKVSAGISSASSAEADGAGLSTCMKSSLRLKSAGNQSVELVDVEGLVSAAARGRAGDEGVVGVGGAVAVELAPRVKPSDEEEGVRVHEDGGDGKGEEGADDGGEEHALLNEVSESEVEPSRSAHSARLVLGSGVHGARGRGRARAARATSARWNGLLSPPGAGPAAGRGTSGAPGREDEGRGGAQSR